MNRFASRIRQARHLAGRGVGRRRSMFSGDPTQPIVMTPEQAAVQMEEGGDLQPMEAMAIEEAASPQEAAEEVAALPEVSAVEVSNKLFVPPNAVTNATMIVNPVTKGILSTNLNYKMQQMLVDYPQEGFIQQVAGAGAGSETRLEIDGLPLVKDGKATGTLALCLLRFNISASALNARAGGNYNMWLEFQRPGSTKTVVTPRYSFQRGKTTEPILGIFIPFETIATRTLPALAQFGYTSDLPSTPEKAVLVVEGMEADEVLTATVPGYTTGELTAIAAAYKLSAGMVV